MPNSALVDISQCATQFNQQGCASFGVKWKECLKASGGHSKLYIIMALLSTSDTDSHMSLRLLVEDIFDNV